MQLRGGWTRDPYGELDGDRLYGVGALDRTAGWAALLDAAASIAADRRKGGRAGFTGICRRDDRFSVITDSGARPEELDEIRATGAAVEVAEEA